MSCARSLLVCVILASALSTAAAPAQFRQSGADVILSHERFEARWSPDGFRFTARYGPSWRWTPAPLPERGSVAPVADAARGRVDYDRGVYVERYLWKNATIEQQFVLRERPAAESDVVIEGTIDSNGAFARASGGWTWSDARGSVTLGDVTVIDAEGNRLPARMHVTADRARITVDGAALARASYPVVVDPEIGANDFRVSAAGTDGDGSSVSQPAIAFADRWGKFLVVWAETSGGDSEIWGRLIDSHSGFAETAFKISDMAGAAPGYTVLNPDVVYNPTADEYLVVWRGEDNVPPLVDNEWEIYGQRLNGRWAGEVGADDFRISFMGPDGSTSSFAEDPAVTCDTVTNRYLVVWSGRDSVAVPNEREIWGRVLDSAGVSLSADDTRLSSVGAAGVSSRGGYDPDAACDSVNARYLVVWRGDHDADNAFDVFGQLVDAGGAEHGADFRISDMGDVHTSNDYIASSPRVVFNDIESEYLVVWSGDNNSPGDDQYEVFGQRLSGGVEVGTNDFRISNVGPPGSSLHGATAADVAVDPYGRYFVVWHGDDGLDDEREVWGRRLDGDGVGVDVDVQLSDAGPALNTTYAAITPQVASAAVVTLVVWKANDDIGTLLNETEVFGQFYDTDARQFIIDSLQPGQGPLIVSEADQVDDHDADSLYVRFGGERNLRVTADDVSGGAVSLSVSDGSLNFMRPAGSSALFMVWWDGDNDRTTTEMDYTETPVDITAGGQFGQFALTVNSTSSSTQQLRLSVFSSTGNVSRTAFTLPAGGGEVLIPFSAFTEEFGTGADFQAVRGLSLGTVSTTGAWAASIGSLTVVRIYPSPATTTITASPSALTGDGVAVSTITVQAKDAGGANLTVGGATIALQTTLGTLTPVTDRGDGTYTAYLRSTSAGLATVTGTISGAFPILDAEVVTFTPATPPGFSATAAGSSSVNLAWGAVGGAEHYVIYRSTDVPSGYHFLTHTTNTYYTDVAVAPDNSYAYKVRATAAGMNGPFSVPDIATTVVYSSPSAAAGQLVRAAHIVELRIAANALSRLASVPWGGFTDNPLTAGTPVRRIHVVELRTNIDGARFVIGLPAVTWTDGTITAGVTRVRAVHVTELRHATE